MHRRSPYFLIRIIGRIASLETLAVLLSDVGGDGLDLSVSLETVLAQLPAGPGLLKPAKWSHRRENIVAIHPEKKNKCNIC